MKIPDSLKSRKLWAVIVAALVVTLNDALGLGLDTESVDKLVNVVTIYLAAQGAVDVTKEFRTVRHDEV